MIYNLIKIVNNAQTVSTEIMIVLYFLFRLIKETLHLPIRILAGLLTSLGVFPIGYLYALGILYESILPENLYQPEAAYNFAVRAFKGLIEKSIDEGPALNRLLAILALPIALLIGVSIFILGIVAQLAIQTFAIVALCPAVALAGFIYGARHGIDMLFHPISRFDGFIHHANHLAVYFSRKFSFDETAPSSSGSSPFELMLVDMHCSMIKRATDALGQVSTAINQTNEQLRSRLNEFRTSISSSGQSIFSQTTEMKDSNSQDAPSPSPAPESSPASSHSPH